MAQDTRKDPRAKIVSLNVRYKSATVDEFIENHSHDVSKGGIFIKTATPFAQGTLLKFEIRLAGDQAVIAGVGRVVWKRETAQAGGNERPAGMGVKFIKIDESSRAVIDRLVDTRADAGSAFTAELPKEEAGIGKSTLLGTGAPRSVPPRPASLPPQKATIMGMGAVKPSTAPPPTASPSSPSPATEGKSTLLGGFFPQTNPEAEMPPPQERTMMKQANELLEEALKGAGGSMEEVGTNPLFSGAAAKDVPDPKEPSAPAISPSGNTLEERSSTKPMAQVASSAPPAAAAPGAEEERKAPWSARPPPGSDRPAPIASARAAVADEPKKGGLSTALLVGGLLLLVAGGVVFAYGKGMLGGGATPVDTAPTTTPSAIPSAPVETPDAAAAGTGTEDASVAEAADAGATPEATTSATGKTPPVTTGKAPTHPAVTAHPHPTPHPTATATATEEPATTATAEPTSAPTATTAPTATAAPTTTATAAPTTTATAKPQPTTTKPKGDEGDNPY